MKKIHNMKIWSKIKKKKQILKINKEKSIKCNKNNHLCIKTGGQIWRFVDAIDTGFLTGAGNILETTGISGTELVGGIIVGSTGTSIIGRFRVTKRSRNRSCTEAFCTGSITGASGTGRTFWGIISKLLLKKGEKNKKYVIRKYVKKGFFT